MGVAGLLTLGAPLDRARAVCVFVHGRGQTPEDMAVQVIRHLTAPDIAFLLPRAATRSWYAARAVDPLTPDTRRELGASLDQLDAVMAQAAGPGRPVLLGGFSQGACLSIEYALRNGPWPGALCALTGARVGTPACDRHATPLAGLRTYLSGSDADPWIPVAAFAETVAALAAAGSALRAESHPGRAHVASPSEIAVLNAMLDDLRT